MPHIDGHIQNGAKSCGILSPSINKKKGLYFIPPAFETKAGREVGFHLLEIPTEGGPILIAYDLIERTRRKGVLTVADTKAEKYADEAYEKTKEYVKFYDNGKKSASQVIRSVLPKLKTVEQLREIKKVCELVSDRIGKNGPGKLKR